MHKYSNSIVLPFNARQLYEIVIDVESYPEFLPWCLSSRIVKKDDDNNFDAELTVGYKAIDEKYISRIQAEYEKKIISKAISGPFKSLDAQPDLPLAYNTGKSNCSSLASRLTNKSNVSSNTSLAL